MNQNVSVLGPHAGFSQIEMQVRKEDVAVDLMRFVRGKPKPPQVIECLPCRQRWVQQT